MNNLNDQQEKKTLVNHNYVTTMEYSANILKKQQK